MLEDVLSLFKYIGNSIPQVDPSRIAVFGSSAGAYPARLAGIYAKPKPKVIAMIYGREPFPLYCRWTLSHVNLRQSGGGDFFSAPYLADPPGCSSDMLREVSHMIHPNPDESAGLKYEWDVMETDPEISTLLSTSNPVRTSRILWTAIMAEGKALDYITGITGLGGKLRASRATSIRPPGSGTTANATFPTRQVSSTTLAGGEAALVNLDLIPSESKRLLPQLCMDANFPPTYLIHGLLDTSVLPEESIRTYDQLRELGVPVELSLVEGEGHCFEWKREEESGIKDILDKAADFLANYLG